MIQARALLLLSFLSFAQTPVSLAQMPVSLAQTPAQDPAPVPDKRPEVGTLLDKLKDHASKVGKEDKDAIAVIDQLFTEFKKSGPKDKQLIVKGISKCFE